MAYVRLYSAFSFAEWSPVIVIDGLFIRSRIDWHKKTGILCSLTLETYLSSISLKSTKPLSCIISKKL